jgi:hypothetical protein
MTLLRALTDVDVPGVESQKTSPPSAAGHPGTCSSDRSHLVRPGLLLLDPKKSDPEPGVVARQRNAIHDGERLAPLGQWTG